MGYGRGGVGENGGGGVGIYVSGGRGFCGGWIRTGSGLCGGALDQVHYRVWASRSRNMTTLL